ncbi:hypothetical protein GpartN1_g4543.t1 [Galdieria partita]|uniref:Cytidyltransferase-like domain-containing protein n=1 Tax=Galdieria partita TaxID=83374 RepID=A0A9C7PZI9_9RHOD|nr:hypothetical protein GpartN1_g4543.t1 [Galdieria partita]
MVVQRGKNGFTNDSSKADPTTQQTMISSPKSTSQQPMASQSLPCSPLLSSSLSLRAKTCWFTLPCVFTPLLSQENKRMMHTRIPKRAVLAALKATQKILYLYVALDAATWPATARYILSALYSMVIESGKTRLDCKVVFQYSQGAVKGVSPTRDEELFSIAEDGKESSFTCEEGNVGWKIEDVEYLDSVDAALTIPGDVASIRRYFRMGVAAVELTLSGEEDDKKEEEFVEKVVDEKEPGDLYRVFVEQEEGCSSAPYEVVAVGGTFDRLHAGHRLLLSVAAWNCRRHLRIGVTGPSLLANKQWKELIEPFEQRVAQVVQFVKSIRPHSLCVTAVELNDVEGPTIEDGSIQALVVSEETYAHSQSVNPKRMERGLKPLDILSVNVLSFTKRMGTSEKLSSTKLREMEAKKRVLMEQISLS